MTRQLFGTDGIRGIPGEYPLDDATLVAIGGALASYLRSSETHPRILLGMDTRLSGPHLAECVAQGAVAAGAVAAFAGVISTPGVALLVREKSYSAGVVLSASHNPFTDNGVKLISPQGTKFSDLVEQGLEGEIFARRDSARKPAPAALQADPSLDSHYLAALRAMILPGARLAGMKMVLDCANGAASELAPALFCSLGAEVTPIHNHPDGRNINAGCGSLHPESLQKKVVEVGAQFGVAFDGDADRAIFSDAAGHLVNGDGVLLAAARYMKQSGALKAGAVVGTTMSNLGLERALEAEGVRLLRAAVGDRYVFEEMQRTGANLGGEQSGHIIFLDHSVTGDGMLTALFIASLISLHGPLAELTAGLAIYPQKILNVRVREKPPLDTLPGVASALAEANHALGNRGRIVLRYSGTETLARVMVEAEHPEEVERWTKAIASAIRSAIGAA
jgi:phosphoglucosamine mutase